MCSSLGKQLLNFRGTLPCSVIHRHQAEEVMQEALLGGLVADELIEITAVGHLAEPGQRAQPHEALPDLEEGSVHCVLLRGGAEHLSGRCQASWSMSMSAFTFLMVNSLQQRPQAQRDSGSGVPRAAHALLW